MKMKSGSSIWLVGALIAFSISTFIARVLYKNVEVKLSRFFKVRLTNQLKEVRL